MNSSFFFVKLLKSRFSQLEAMLDIVAKLTSLRKQVCFYIKPANTKTPHLFNSFMTEVPIIQKPVHWTGFNMIGTSVMKELRVCARKTDYQNFKITIFDYVGNILRNSNPCETKTITMKKGQAFYATLQYHAKCFESIQVA